MSSPDLDVDSRRRDWPQRSAISAGLQRASGAVCGPRRRSSQKARKGATPAPAPTMILFQSFEFISIHFNSFQFVSIRFCGLTALAF